MKPIVIIIKGGAIHAVNNVPEGLTVEVRDYDIDGCDEAQLITDSSGEQFIQDEWKQP